MKLTHTMYDVYEHQVAAGTRLPNGSLSCSPDLACLPACLALAFSVTLINPTPPPHPVTQAVQPHHT